MFGIKTKKDKRIEALENQLHSMYFKHPHIITTQGNVISLAATQVLEDGMPPDYAKRKIAEKFVDEAMRFVHYDLGQCGRDWILRGYIRIVADGSEEKENG